MSADDQKGAIFSLCLPRPSISILFAVADVFVESKSEIYLERGS